MNSDSQSERVVRSVTDFERSDFGEQLEGQRRDVGRVDVRLLGKAGHNHVSVTCLN